MITKKIQGILEFLEVDQTNLDKYTRIGRNSEDGKDRPIKLFFKNKHCAFMLLKNAPKLRDLQNAKIYIKADKTRKEEEEKNLNGYGGKKIYSKRIIRL